LPYISTSHYRILKKKRKTSPCRIRIR